MLIIQVKILMLILIVVNVVTLMLINQIFVGHLKSKKMHQNLELL